MGPGGALYYFQHPFVKMKRNDGRKAWCVITQKFSNSIHLCVSQALFIAMIIQEVLNHSKLLANNLLGMNDFTVVLTSCTCGKKGRWDRRAAYIYMQVWTDKVRNAVLIDEILDLLALWFLQCHYWLGA